MAIMRTMPPTSAYRPARATGAVRRQRGLSLIELMVVMVIVGIVTGGAVYAVNKGPRVEDEGRRIANIISEGVRQAIASGPVDHDFILGSGLDWPIQIRFRFDASANTHVMTIYRLTPSPFALDEISSKYMPEEVEITGFLYEAKTDTGTTEGDLIELTGITETNIYVRADGSCFAGPNPFTRRDALTLFLQTTTDPRVRARVVIMPLGGQSIVLNGW